jgi:DNA-binding response OmpR family regulator
LLRTRINAITTAMAILIIEDEKKLVEILKTALKGERYSVDAAYDGEEGLDKAMKNNYSLIILDIMLPKKDGFEVCRELRSHADCQRDRRRSCGGARCWS